MVKNSKFKKKKIKFENNCPFQKLSAFDYKQNNIVYIWSKIFEEEKRILDKN